MPPDTIAAAAPSTLIAGMITRRTSPGTHPPGHTAEFSRIPAVKQPFSAPHAPRRAPRPPLGGTRYARLRTRRRSDRSGLFAGPRAPSRRVLQNEPITSPAPAHHGAPHLQL